METVRSRAIQVLGGASIAASVFGGLVMRRGEPLQLMLGGLAVAAFVVLAVFGMLVLKSRPVTLAVKPQVLVEWVETPHVTQSLMERKVHFTPTSASWLNLVEVWSASSNAKPSTAAPSAR
jgi:hypothetical protein